MSENDEYLKTKCPRCQTTIEFAKHGIGQQVPCPTCQWIITLKRPFPKAACAIRIFCGLFLVAGAVAVIKSKPASHPAPLSTTETTADDTNRGQQIEITQPAEPAHAREEQAKAPQEASPLLTAANGGDPAAQYQIASNYFVQENYTEAVKWLRRAADQGFAAAQTELGRSYLNGEAVGKDYVEAVKWFRKAADQNYPDGECALADCYMDGVGVSKNFADAAKWWRKAADQGDAEAQLNLGTSYAQGEGVAKNSTEAVKWFRKAADQGNPDAQCNLGICYANGQGVAKNDAEGVKWYRKAAEQGESDAENNLGTCYEHGQGIGQDYMEAVKWYRKAAEQGTACAQANLAACYAKGVGVVKDEVTADAWLNLSAAQGYGNARVFREVLEQGMTHAEIVEAQRLARELQARIAVHYRAAPSSN
jgi:TPR repeat protein